MAGGYRPATGPFTYSDSERALIVAGFVSIMSKIPEPFHSRRKSGRPLNRSAEIAFFHLEHTQMVGQADLFAKIFPLLVRGENVQNRTLAKKLHLPIDEVDQIRSAFVQHRAILLLEMNKLLRQDPSFQQKILLPD